MEKVFIETPIGKNKVELKAWLTELDYRKIDLAQVASDNIKMKMRAEDAEGSMPAPIMDLTGKEAVGLQQSSQNAKIEAVITSIDGVKEKIVETLLGFRRKDFNFIIDKIDEIISGDEEKKKIAK